MRRPGLTLIEVCLVLALLVVIGSFAIPLLGGAIERRALESGADLFQAALSRARLAAMQSGQTYAVRLEPKGSRFQVLDLDKLGMPESEELQPEDPDVDRPPADILRLSQNRMPEGVVFADAKVSDSNELTATYGSTEGAWSAPILFRPDGTTSDASVVLKNEPGNTIRVTLRGITGTSSAGEVGSEEVP
jgi:type II secretory pathway pseudopilin PulG